MQKNTSKKSKMDEFMDMLHTEIQATETRIRETKGTPIIPINDRKKDRVNVIKSNNYNFTLIAAFLIPIAVYMAYSYIPNVQAAVQVVMDAFNSMQFFGNVDPASPIDII